MQLSIYGKIIKKVIYNIYKILINLFLKNNIISNLCIDSSCLCFLYNKLRLNISNFI